MTPIPLQMVPVVVVVLQILALVAEVIDKYEVGAARAHLTNKLFGFFLD
nr:hypothetical protein [Dickeya sp. CFBP 2040]